MTKTFDKLLDNLFKDFHNRFIGWDDTLDHFKDMCDQFEKNISNYPPYNLKKTGDNSYVLEVAVAGFGKNEISIDVSGDTLVISGSTKDSSENDENVIFKGIAARDFTRTWSIADHIEVKNAEMLNGMLRIFLEKMVPEPKTKKIEIKESAA